MLGDQLTWQIMENNKNQNPTEPTQAESENRYCSIIEVMRDGIIVQDAQGKILDCNAEVGRIFGLPVKEITARLFLKPQWEPIQEKRTPARFN